MMGKQQQETMDATVRMIAKQVLWINTLDYRGSDALDFHERGVGTIKQALEEAYIAGLADGQAKIEQL